VSNLCPNLLAFAPMAWQPQMKSKKAKLYMHNSHEADSGGFIARRFCLVAHSLFALLLVGFDFLGLSYSDASWTTTKLWDSALLGVLS